MKSSFYKSNNKASRTKRQKNDTVLTRQSQEYSVSNPIAADESSQIISGYFLNEKTILCVQFFSFQIVYQ